MKKLFVALMTAPLLGTIPLAAEAADLRLTSVQISVGVRSEKPACDSRPQVVYREHDRRYHGNWKKARRDCDRRSQPQVIVIDRTPPRRSCDPPPVVIVTQPRYAYYR